ncbi:MAG TPA: 7-carboxy-7-deazaguanine synthase [Steroidobacteraceae bacterium]|nr:7-carboxy-7-deazaguanine synthase [Steroidobacteraceae bacterium]
MAYAVKEIYYTLQGEGAHSGRPAVFLRFAGCNLWTGLERDRAKGPGGCSRWCDTDFVGTDGPGGGKFASAGQLVSAVTRHWPAGGREGSALPFVVCTGGEPLLQLDAPLLAQFNSSGWQVAVETNGTVLPPAGELWITVSPKAGATLRVLQGDELKLVYPQVGAEPERFAALHFEHFFLQPLDGPERARHTELAVQYCLGHPRWRLSLQTHKILSIR